MQYFIRFYLLSFTIIFSTFGCISQNPTDRKMVVYKGCESREVISDLDWSINQNLKWFEKYKIELVTDTISQKCGYKFVNNDKSKTIKSAQTDVDLLFLVRDFFDIEN